MVKLDRDCCVNVNVCMRVLFELRRTIYGAAENCLDRRQACLAYNKTDA